MVFFKGFVESFNPIPLRPRHDSVASVVMFLLKARQLAGPARTCSASAPLPPEPFAPSPWTDPAPPRVAELA